MSVILGLNAFHADSAACLLIDGKLVGAVAEERLGARIKHSSAFPREAIRWLLADNGIRFFLGTDADRCLQRAIGLTRQGEGDVRLEPSRPLVRQLTPG